MGCCCTEGIGDTIRVSLTPRVGGDRRDEVYAACEILQSLGLRSFVPSVTSCPGCGRTTGSFFQQLAEETEAYVREKMPEWKHKYLGVETLTLAVMGCVVNGPGESRSANIGISLPGSGEEPKCPVYVDGNHTMTLIGSPGTSRRGVPRSNRNLRGKQVPSKAGRGPRLTFARLSAAIGRMTPTAEASQRIIASPAPPSAATGGRTFAAPCGVRQLAAAFANAQTPKKRQQAAALHMSR